MSENISNLVAAIKDGDALGTEHAFADAIADKLSDKLDAMRQDVAKNMFASPEAVMEDDVEVDETEAEVEVAEVEEAVNEVSADMAKRAFDARAKKHDKATNSASSWEKSADRASGRERSDRLRHAADHQKRAKDMEKKMDRSARKGGFDAQDRYKKVTSEAK